MADARQAWEEVGESFTSLGRLLRDKFERPKDEERASEVQDALASLGEAARRLGDAVLDPELQQTAQRVALSLGAAITATLSQVTGEIEEALRPPPRGDDTPSGG